MSSNFYNADDGPPAVYPDESSRYQHQSRTADKLKLNDSLSSSFSAKWEQLGRSKFVQRLLGSRIDNLLPTFGNKEGSAARARLFPIAGLATFILYRLLFRPPVEHTLDPYRPVKVLVLAYPRYITPLLFGDCTIKKIIAYHDRYVWEIKDDPPFDTVQLQR